MNTLDDIIRTACYQKAHIILTMESGVEIRFPIQGNPRLSRGTPEQLNHIIVSPYGLHWPDLDEDLSLQGLLYGDYGGSRHA